MIGQAVIAFVATADQARSRAFYEGVLGLPVTEESGFATAYDANGVQLRVQVVDDVAPHAYTAAGWAVDDIVATIAELEGRGVRFDERGVWASPSGARVAWFRDPDGNVLSLTQRS